MTFIYCNQETGKIIGILPDRRLRIFFKISFNKVIDMYKPYMMLIGVLFPNAKISLDGFHLVQLINRNFNKIRIKIMNEYKSKNERFYNKLKKFWSLL